MRVVALLLLLSSGTAGCGPLANIAQREDIATARYSPAVSEAKIAITVVLISGDGVPADAAAIGRSGETVPPATAPADSIGKLEVRNGTIIVTLGGAAREDIAGETFALSPCLAVAGHEVQWACGFSSCSAGYALAPGALEPGPLTTLQPVQLTVDCR